jgi:hypothetical protein
MEIERIGDKRDVVTHRWILTRPANQQKVHERRKNELLSRSNGGNITYWCASYVPRQTELRKGA